MQTDVLFIRVMHDYVPYINSCASGFPSHHCEDLCQEGLIGLYQACQTYNADRGVPLEAYAKICIKRKMISAYRMMKKDDFTSELAEDADIEAGTDDADASVTREFFDELRCELTPLEAGVLDGYLEDRKYSEIAKDMSISQKQVDNALARIKNKIKAKYNK